MTTPVEQTRPASRNLNPYTAEEITELKRLHASGTTTRSTTPEDGKERLDGDLFCKKIWRKKQLGFSWRELAEPLGLKGRTVNAYLNRHGYTEDGSKSNPPYLNKSINTNHRTKEFYPCGIHRIGIDPAYGPSKPGGKPRCATCVKAKRKKHWAEVEYPRELAKRQAVEAARERNLRAQVGERLAEVEAQLAAERAAETTETGETGEQGQDGAAA